MPHVLIPFALQESTGQLVAVDDVSSGKACGCICPGCQTPLVARHSREGTRASNFAHSGRKDYQQTKAQCTYSYLVSVRSMSKQILAQLHASMQLPAVIGMIDARRWPAFGETLFRPAREFMAAPSQAITLTPAQVQVEVEFAGAIVDVLQQTPGERSLVIYFTYEQRPIPQALRDSTESFDLLQIDLTNIAALFKRMVKKSYISALTDFLCEDLDAKNWIKHTGHAALKELKEVVSREEAQMETEARYRAAERVQQQAQQRKAMLQAGLQPKRNISQVPIYGASSFGNSPYDYRQPLQKIRYPQLPESHNHRDQKQVPYRCRHCNAEYYQAKFAQRAKNVKLAFGI
jgi:hypothetical protein